MERVRCHPCLHEVPLLILSEKQPHPNTHMQGVENERKYRKSCVSSLNVEARNTCACVHRYKAKIDEYYNQITPFPPKQRFGMCCLQHFVCEMSSFRARSFRSAHHWTGIFWHFGLQLGIALLLETPTCKSSEHLQLPELLQLTVHH